MHKLVATQKFAAIILLSAAGVLVSAWTFVRLSSGALDARASIIQIQADTKRFEEDQVAARTLAKVVGERTADIGRLKAFFVDRQEPVAFIEQLEDLGRATHTSVSLSLPSSSGSTDNGVLSFRITVDGSPDNLVTYVKLLGLLPYNVALHDLAFQKLEEGQGIVGAPTGSHRLTLLISVATSEASGGQ